MADLQSTVVTGTFEATQGFTNITEASFTTKVTAPLMVGVGNVVQMENKSDAGSRGTIDIDATGNINLGGDGGVINVNKAMVYGALDFTVDTDTLYVDAANDRVGVNISPAESMHVSGNSVATGDIVSNYSDVRLKKNIIGIEKEKRKTFLNRCLISLTSFISFALDSSGNKISKLAAKSWKIISRIRLDHARTPRRDPE